MIIIPYPDYNGVKITYYDKIFHALMFGGFSWLFIYAFRAKKIKLRTLIWLSIAVGAAYSGFCEYIQNFIPGRDVSEWDFLGGMIGILIAALVSYGLYKPKT